MKIATLILYIGTMTTSLVAQETKSGWYEIPNPSNEFFNDIAFINADTGYIIGNNGLILSTNDGGNSWSEKTQLTTYHLKHIELISDTEGIIVGDSGLVMRTVNKGKTWSVLTTNHSYNLEQSVFLDSNIGYASWRFDSKVLKTENGGVSWTDIGWDIPNDYYSVHSLVKRSDTSVVAILNARYGSATQFFEVTNNNYGNWIKFIGEYETTSTYLAEDGYLYAAFLIGGSEPKLYRTTDHSYYFNPLERVYTGDTYALTNITYSHGWFLAAGGSPQNIIISTNGTEWVEQPIYEYDLRDISAVEILSENTAVFIVNDNKEQGRIKKTNTRGAPIILDAKNELVSNIQLYPNPTHDNLSVIINTNNEVYFKVYNSIGELQISGKLTNSIIDLSSLSPAIYYINFITGDINETHKILKIY